MKEKRRSDEKRQAMECEEGNINSVDNTDTRNLQ